MAHVVSRQPLNAEVRVRSQLVLFETCVGQGGNGTGTSLTTRSVRKVSDLFFLCEHLMDYNLARLHEPTLNLSAHA